MAQVSEDRTMTIVERPDVVIAQRDLDMYREHFCTDAPENEWLIFVQKCKLLGLNPMLNEVYLVGRNTKVKDSFGKDKWVKKFATQVAITGLISLAERTQRYEGHTKAEYYDADLNVYDVWPTSQGKHPYAIRIGVYKRGWREASYAIVYFHERAQYFDKSSGKLTTQWEAQGIHMLLKCALAAALRWAFQETCGGVYIHEEMGTADQEAKEISITPRVTVEAAPDGLKPTAQIAQEAQQEAQPVFVPTNKAIYTKGTVKGLWNDTDGYLAFASKQLEVEVTRQTVLTNDQKIYLYEMVDTAQSALPQAS